MSNKENWLYTTLAANGFSAEDLAEQTGLSLKQINEAAKDSEANEEAWNLILSQINDYPTIDYPSAEILDDLQSDIDSSQPDSLCQVFYGVNASQLIFCDYVLEGQQAEHGANVNLTYLSSLTITLAEALQLFTKQNYTINSEQTPA